MFCSYFEMVTFVCEFWHRQLVYKMKKTMQHYCAVNFCGDLRITQCHCEFLFAWHTIACIYTGLCSDLFNYLGPCIYLCACMLQIYFPNYVYPKRSTIFFRVKIDILRWFFIGFFWNLFNLFPKQTKLIFLNI